MRSAFPYKRTPFHLSQIVGNCILSIGDYCPHHGFTDKFLCANAALHIKMIKKRWVNICGIITLWAATPLPSSAAKVEARQRAHLEHINNNKGPSLYVVPPSGEWWIVSLSHFPSKWMLMLTMVVRGFVIKSNWSLALVTENEIESMNYWLTWQGERNVLWECINSISRCHHTTLVAVILTFCIFPYDDIQQSCIIGALLLHQIRS